VRGPPATDTQRADDCMKTAETARTAKRILIVDDHPLICRGLAQVIDQEGDLRVCGDAGDINDAMKKIESLAPDLVVVDISLKSSSGIDLIKAVRARNPRLPAIVYSMHDESVYAERALRAGANGYVMKDRPAEVLISAIRKVLDGNKFFSDEVISRILGRIAEEPPGNAGDPIARLTDRELEVFQLMGRELKTAQIAKKLNISVKTVEAHREHIRKKLDIENSHELARRAREWVTSSPRPPSPIGEGGA